MKKFRRYLIVLSIGFALAILVGAMRDLFSQTEAKVIFKILCDAFFVPGIFISAAGLIVFSTNEGTFDAMAYGISAFVNMFKREPLKKRESFYDYRASRSEKKVKFGYLLITGGAFLLVSMIMLAIHLAM
jgi:hypothetical protein